MVHLYRVAHRNTRHWLRRAVYFFPLQLLVLHLKKNHLLLFFWLVLWAYVTGNLGQKYGIPYLFLYPEYMGAVTPGASCSTGSPWAVSSPPSTCTATPCTRTGSRSSPR
ncbi:MAG: hypothetical protein IPM68_12985 [Flavobacteriales bacterium]|nr:hypothetical protein [Flavobacteriales bacterium]